MCFLHGGWSSEINLGRRLLLFRSESVRHSDSFRLLKKGQQFKWVPTNLTQVSKNNWNSSIPEPKPKPESSDANHRKVDTHASKSCQNGLTRTSISASVKSIYIRTVQLEGARNLGSSQLCDGQMTIRTSTTRTG